MWSSVTFSFCFYFIHITSRKLLPFPARLTRICTGIRSVISCTCEITPILRPCVRRLSSASIAIRKVSASNEPNPSSLSSGWKKGTTNRVPTPAIQGKTHRPTSYAPYGSRHTYPGRSPAKPVFQAPAPTGNGGSGHATAHLHS